MINANELRVGNLFYKINRSGTVHLPIVIPMKVLEISPFNVLGHLANQDPAVLDAIPVISMSDVSPIPITREILEKCGFITDGFYNSAERWVLLDVLLFRGNGHFILCHYPKTEIKYLHQLQNLYFALTGKELIYTP